MRKKRLVAVLLSLLVVIDAMSFSASAISTGRDYQYDEEQSSIHAPSAYDVQDVLYGSSFGAESLRNPSDLFVDNANNIYIVDSGNNRILILNEQFQLLETIDSVTDNGEVSMLSNPMGIYKDEQEDILYICDTGNARVVAVNSAREIVLTISGESMPSVNQNLTFSPEKVVVDRDKNIFVVSSAIYQGIVRFLPDGSFDSFYAPNSVKMTVEVFFVSLWKKFFTSEQKDMMAKTLPASYNNLMLDDEGFIYATSSDAKPGEEVKRLNAVGDNVLKVAGKNSGGQIFGDYEITVEDQKSVTNSFVDVDVDDEGIVTVIDGKSNKIFQYDQGCNLIAVFGGIGTQKGKFRKIVSVVSLNGKYLVLDRDKGSVTVFEPSPYIVKIRSALQDYNQGLYIQSEATWREILRENSNFLIAYRSIGRAALQQNRYGEALQMLKQGDDPYFYSLTLEEYRKEFIRENLLFMLLGVVVCIGIAITLYRVIRRRLLA